MIVTSNGLPYSAASILDRLLNSGCDQAAGTAVGVKQERDKLVVAISEQHVGGPETTLGRTHYSAQNSIAFMSAMFVVDSLEALHINEQYRNGFFSLIA